MAKGSVVANAVVTIVPSMEGSQTAIKREMGSTVKEAAAAAGTTGGKELGSKIGGGLSTAKIAIGNALGNIVSNMAGKALDGLKSLSLGAFGEVEAGTNKVLLATGATGKAAQDLNEVYKDVARGVTGSFEDVGSAVGEINTRLGLTGDSLREASTEMMKYAKVTGQDATLATKDVASMMNNIGIPADKLGETLDKLTVAGQAAGIDVSNLATNVTKYSSVMKTMGFTTDETIAIMSQFEKSGADTSSVLNAMKKGVATWAKDGKNAGEEFKKFVDGVKDGSTTAGDAVKIFGSKGGLAMFEAAQKGQLSFEEMFDAISNSGGALDSVYEDTLTATDKMDIAFKNIQLASAEIFAPAFEAASSFLSDVIVPMTQSLKEPSQMLRDVFGKALEKIFGLVEEYGPMVQDAFNKFGESIGNAGAKLQEVFGNTDFQPLLEGLKSGIDTVVSRISGAMVVVGKLVEFVADAIAGFVDWLNNDPIGQQVMSIFNGIAQVVEGAFTYIESIVDLYGSLIYGIATGDFSGMSDAIEGIMTGLGQILDGIWNGICGGIAGIFGGLMDTLAGIGEGISNAVVGALNGLWQGITETAKGIGDGILKFFGGIWDGIVKTASDAWGRLVYEVKSIPKRIEFEFERVKGTIRAAFDFAKAAATKKLGEIIDKVKSIPGNVKAALMGIAGRFAEEFGKAKDRVANTIGGILDRIRAIPGKIADFLRSVPQKIANAFSNIHIPTFHIEGEFNLLEGKVPSLAFYKTGGLFDVPTPIVGEAGPELATPLYDPYMDRYAKTMAGYLERNGSAGGDSYNINVDGQAILASPLLLNKFLEFMTLLRQEAMAHA